jgi:hypothetical protein
LLKALIGPAAVDCRERKPSSTKLMTCANASLVVNASNANNKLEQRIRLRIGATAADALAIEDNSSE